MLTKNEFVKCLAGITYVQTRQQKRRYKLKLNGDYIVGEGLDNNPRLSLKYLLMIFMTHIRTELILR